jgi:hypothetical protein
VRQLQTSDAASVAALLTYTDEQERAQMCADFVKAVHSFTLCIAGVTSVDGVHAAGMLE